jgi:hypothetical protein
VAQVALMLLLLAAIYGSVIAGLVWLIRRWQATNGHAVFVSFLIFGLVTGILAVLLWPRDSSVLPNVLGVLAGDWVYVQAIERIGDPHSSQAHYTIPWILRVPQVYVITSIGISVSMGWALERIVELLKFQAQR